MSTQPNEIVKALREECDDKGPRGAGGCVTRACLMRGGWNGRSPVPLSVRAMCRNKAAADLIDRQSARIAELEKALKAFRRAKDYLAPDPQCRKLFEIADTLARAALSKEG